MARLEADAEPADPGLVPLSVVRVDLERAIARLDEGRRAVLVLHDVEGYTHAEIAHLLGIEPGTSKSRLHRARRELRTELAGLDRRPEEEAG